MNVFDLGDYTNCKIYYRSNMNIQLNSPEALLDRSEIRCDVNVTNKVLFIISDKNGFPTAKNNIYHVWYDSEGYKALIVDQNGAGSGEGNGKILLLDNPNYNLLACFYYIPEDFIEEDIEPFATNKPPYTRKL